MMKFDLFVLLTLAAIVSGAKLRVIRAGDLYGASWKLKDGFSVCKDDYPGGLSVICEASDVAGVDFYVNGVFVRTEGKEPYAINGNTKNQAISWNPPMGETTLECKPKNQDGVKVTGTFGCTMPKMAPSSTAGIDKDYCVGIKATSHEGSLKSGWTKDGVSLWFKRNDDSLGIASPVAAPLKYKFQVPIESTYGFTLDMDVGGGIDHNDVYVSMVESSWTVHGNNKMTGMPQALVKTGPTKAYHNNADGRNKLAFTIDFNQHTFSTTEILYPNRDYTLIISGRSSKLQLFGAVLFPCNDAQCRSGSSHWKRYVSLCDV